MLPFTGGIVNTFIEGLQLDWISGPVIQPFDSTASHQ